MRLNVEIKGDLYDEFSKHCESEGRSISDVIRSLVIGYSKEKRNEENQKLEMLRIGERNDG